MARGLLGTKYPVPITNIINNKDNTNGHCLGKIIIKLMKKPLSSTEFNDEIHNADVHEIGHATYEKKPDILNMPAAALPFFERPILVQEKIIANGHEHADRRGINKIPAGQTGQEGINSQIDGRAAKTNHAELQKFRKKRVPSDE